MTSPRTKRLDGCPVCDSPDADLLFSAKDRLHGTPGEFSYRKCKSCGSVFQNPMVIGSDLYLCYPTDYTPHSLIRELPKVDFDHLPSAGLRNKIRKAIVESVRGRAAGGTIGLIGSLMAKSSVLRTRAFYGLVMDECLPAGTGPHFALDVGCGAGWLIQRLKKVGWTVDGLEWDEDAAARAAQTTGCSVWSGDFLTAELPESKYQLVILNHVFEHFANPRAVLAKIHRLLADNGKAVLLYPNPEALGTRYYGDEWFPWDPPRHLILPSVPGIRAMAQGTGFRASSVYSRADYSEVQWQRSRAYRVGRNPETDAPPLEIADRLGVAAEWIVTTLGFGKGWETVAVLEK